MRIEVAHKQSEPLSGALYREQIQILSIAYELHLSKWSQYRLVSRPLILPLCEQRFNKQQNKRIWSR